MKPSKPEWYAMLKQEPFVIRTFDSEQGMKVMAKLSVKEKKRDLKIWRHVSLLAAVMLFVLIVVTFPEKRHTVVRPQPILDEKNQILYLDPNWRIPREVFDVYQSTNSLAQTSILAELPPTDIFKLWLLTVRFNNEAFPKQLVVQDSTEMIPRDKIITSWEKWKKNYYITEKIQGNSAELSLTPDSASSEAYLKGGERKIRFIKSESGIWQIDQKDVREILSLTP
jgi:hypothetical protein